MAKEWAKPFYNNKAWKIRRGEALRRDHYTCHDCDARAEEVHHIIELTPKNIIDPKVSLAMSNLMSLCHECHNKRSAGSVGDLGDEYAFDDNGNVIIR